MKASQWHEQAVAPQAALPPPLVSDALGNLSTTGRELYAGGVRAALRRRAVRSPIHERASEEMTRSLDAGLLEPAGARTILALSAPYTAGKTTQVKHWSQALYRQWASVGPGSAPPRWNPKPTMDTAVAPVCYLTLLSAARRNDLYAQILGFLGHPSTGAQRALADRAVLALANHRTRLIILDDAHMLKTSNQTGRETLDAIKHINTELGELGGVLLLVGAHISNSELLTDPQIEGRLAEHIIEPYRADTNEHRREWQALLRGIENQIVPYLPHNQAGFIANENVSYVWKRTQGYIGDTTRLLFDGAAEAIAADQPLDRQILEQVRLSQRATVAYRDIRSRERRARRNGDRPPKQ